MYRRRILCTGGVYYVLFMALLIFKFFWREGLYGWGGRELLLNGFEAGKILYEGPKESRFPGSTPSNAPCNGSCPPQIHYVPRHINSRYINSYYPGWKNISVVWIRIPSPWASRIHIRNNLSALDVWHKKIPVEFWAISCLTAVLRIGDVYSGFRIQIPSRIRIQGQKDSWSRIRNSIKEFKYF